MRPSCRLRECPGGSGQAKARENRRGELTLEGDVVDRQYRAWAAAMADIDGGEGRLPVMQVQNVWNPSFQCTPSNIGGGC